MQLLKRKNVFNWGVLNLSLLDGAENFPSQFTGAPGDIFKLFSLTNSSTQRYSNLYPQTLS